MDWTSWWWLSSLKTRCEEATRNTASRQEDFSKSPNFSKKTVENSNLSSFVQFLGVKMCQVALISRPLQHRVIGAGQALVRGHCLLIAPRLERPVFAKGITIIQIRPVLKILGDGWVIWMLGMVGYGWVWLVKSELSKNLQWVTGPYLDKWSGKDWVCCCPACYMHDEVTITGWSWFVRK